MIETDVAWFIFGLTCGFAGMVIVLAVLTYGDRGRK